MSYHKTSAFIPAGCRLGLAMQRFSLCMRKLHVGDAREVTVSVLKNGCACRGTTCGLLLLWLCLSCTPAFLCPLACYVFLFARVKRGSMCRQNIQTALELVTTCLLCRALKLQIVALPAKSVCVGRRYTRPLALVGFGCIAALLLLNLTLLAPPGHGPGERHANVRRSAARTQSDVRPPPCQGISFGNLFCHPGSAQCRSSAARTQSDVCASTLLGSLPE